MLRPTFLLENAHNVSTSQGIEYCYDDEFQVNMILIKGEATPVCTISEMITGSKTEAAPGDDDPDPDVDLLY